MPDPMTRSNIDQLFSRNAATRLGAATKLGISGAERLEPEEYLIRVAEALGRLRDPGALPRLQTLLGHPDALVRVSAAGAVAQIHPEVGLRILEALLEEDDREVRAQAVEAIRFVASPEAPRILCRVLHSLYHHIHGIDRSDDWTVNLRRSVALALGLEEYPYALPSLMHAAGDGDPVVRANAMLALGTIRDPAAVPVLLGGLSDKDGKVRARTAAALDNYHDDRVVDALLSTLTDPNPKVVVAAIRTLAALREPRAEPALLQAIGGDSDQVAREAERALAKLGHRICVRTLIDQLHAPGTDTDTRATAAAVLGVSGDRQATRPLLTALGRDAVPVRTAAARALGRLGDRQAVHYLTEVLESDQCPEVLLEVAQALGQLGDPSAAVALETAMASPNQLLRETARRALIRVGRAQIGPSDPQEPAPRGRSRSPRLLMKRGTFDQRL